MMLNRKIVTFGLLSLSTLFLTGCIGQSQPNQTGPQVVKVGVLKPLSGPMANYGTDAVNTYSLMVNDFNSSQNDLKVELIVEDDKAAPKDGMTAIQKLITVDQVDAILGSSVSSVVMATAPFAQENNIPYISVMPSTRAISEIGDKVFRYRNDDDYVKKTAEYLESEGIKSVMFLAPQMEFTAAYRDILKEYYSGQVEEFFFPADEKDYNLIAKQLKTKLNNAEYLIFMALGDDVIMETMNALDQEGLLDIFRNKIIVNEFIIKDTVIAALWEKIQGAKVSALGIGLEMSLAGKQFLEYFAQYYPINGADYNIVMEAEGVQMLLDSIAKAKKEQISIDAAIKTINSNTPRTGLFGTYYFDHKGEAEGIQYDIQQFSGANRIKIY